MMNLPSDNTLPDGLSYDVDLMGVVSIKKGHPNQNPRGGSQRNITFKINEGFDVLRAKVMIFQQEQIYNNVELVENGKNNYITHVSSSSNLFIF